ncbi:MAG: hypothetical protein JW993_11210 [Sedimentisphaerales bacterium]|nr:hypothetical protein [Sedimentisphaerales bacterium]
MATKKVCAVIGAILLGLAAGGRAEVQVNSYVQHNQTGTAVAMNDSGNFVVVWRSHLADGRGGGVFGRTFTADGTPSSEEFKVNLSTVDVDGWHPVVAMDPSGGFVVVWVARRAAGASTVARVFGPEGQPLTDELQVGTAPDAVESGPSIAMNSTGAFVVAWTSWCDDGHLGRTYVSACVYDPDGSPVTDVFLVDDVPQGLWPDVAMDESGGFVTSWIRMGDTYNRPYGEYIMLRRYRPDGLAAGTAVQVTDNLNNRWYGPSVAGAPDGSFVLTWAVGPFPYNVWAQSFDATGMPVTEPYLVNTSVQGNQGRPCIAGAAGQDYLIVWDCDLLDGTACGVRAQFCTPNGAFVGDELVLTADGCGRQWYADAAMAADGRYVVVWVGDGQDGSGYGVFADVGPKQE